ncbi:hypothetical protein PM082_011995 [Marasmius tenuissimus]|nr:hypothetical protein PM082_011995 [Marasmius tenuissimus]
MRPDDIRQAETDFFLGFKTDTDPCKRCLNGGHECMIPGRKKRRTRSTRSTGVGSLVKREALRAVVREKAETIEKLTKLDEAEENLKRTFADDSELQAFLEQKGEWAQQWLDEMQQV